MKVLYTDVLVVGGGLAGLRCAIAVKRRGHDVIVLSLVPAKRSHSAAAQGGMQASLANALRAHGDNEDVHFTDTVKGSDWGCDQQVARMFANTAPKAVREMATWGVPWSRVRSGNREIVANAERITIHEPEESHGLITARDFGGTKKWRTCFTADGTGHTLLYAMDNQVIASGVPVHERKEVLALIHDAGHCDGAVVRDLITGELTAYLAKATVMATGGYGRIYAVTTNAVIVEGMGAALALETGLAPLGNMEAVQFHPTAIVPAGILMTEGCRGDGGLLRDVDGYRFMPDYEPEKKELASRDVVSRRMTEHMRKGKGVHSPYGDHLWLDITGLGREHIERNLREVREICLYFLGIDPEKDYIPVRPTHHYSMGGIRTRPTGESPGLDGLFAIGEAACWDLHGFNRLGGNSLAETVVAGMLVGEYVADHCERVSLDISTRVVESFVEREARRITELVERADGENVFDLKAELQQVMTEQVGIFREESSLEKGVQALRSLLVRGRSLALKTKVTSSNPELVQALRVPRMIKLALTVACGALARKESRGAHARVDHPERNDREWLKRTLATWSAESDELPTLAYEEIDPLKMELPPGSRGYGNAPIIPHPDTEVREREIEAVKARKSDADRFEISHELNPVELPERYRGKNERIGVGFE
ncbi:MAG: fumarate reductase flavoprotein subunit [Myxococcota bacterium]